MFTDDYNRDPDFVNDEGFKWWLCKSLTEWARKSQSRYSGEDMPEMNNVTVFMVEEPNTNRTYVIIHDGKPVYSSQQYEAVATHLDMMKLDVLFTN